MLVLSRKVNETIIIDGNIRITVVGLRGTHVRIGIQAPAEVTILREELCPYTSLDKEPTGADDRAGRGDLGRKNARAVPASSVTSQ